MPSFLERQFRIERGARQGLHQRLLRSPDATGTLLYIHGLGESALCFERLMADPRLTGWHQLAVDLEGYGKSTWASEPRSEPLSLDAHAERLAELIDKRDVVVVGHSMGGVIGSRLCEVLGKRSRAFINIEGNISSGDCGYSGQAVKYTLDEWLAHGFDQVLDAIYRHEGESTEVRRAYGASILMCDPRTFHRNSEDLVEISTAETGARRLAALDAAVLFVHGAPRAVPASALSSCCTRRESKRHASTAPVTGLFWTSTTPSSKR